MSGIAEFYKSIDKETEAAFIDQGSRFLAYAFPVKNEVEIKKALNILRQKYPDATHHCYAWQLNINGTNNRANDDGEPSGSAGRPILNQILAAGFTNILVVVVRYFGGKKLGIPGLIAAYGYAARLCLMNCRAVEGQLLDYYILEVNTEQNYMAFNLARKLVISIMEPLNTENSKFCLAIPRSKKALLEEACNNLANFVLTFDKTE